MELAAHRSQRRLEPLPLCAQTGGFSFEAGDALPHLPAGALHFREAALRLFKVTLLFLELLGQLLQALHRFAASVSPVGLLAPERRPQAFDLDQALRDPGQLPALLLQSARRVLRPAEGAGHRFLQRMQLPRLGCQLLPGPGQRFPGPLQFGGEAGCSLAGTLDAAMNLGLVLPGPLQKGPGQLSLVLRVQLAPVQFLKARVKPLYLLVQRVHRAAHLGQFGLRARRRGFCLVPVLFPLPQGRRQLGGLSLQFQELADEQPDLDLAQPLGHPFIRLGRFRLGRQRAEAGFHLADDVAEADEVLLRLGELEESLPLFHPVLADPGRLFEKGTPLLRPGAQDGVHLALADDGRATRARAPYRETAPGYPRGGRACG